MGLNSANIALRHPSRPDLQPLAVQALVDTGAVTLCIPQHVAVQLQPGGTGHREVTTADEAEWRAAACEQSARDDAPADAIYDSLR